MLDVAHAPAVGRVAVAARLQGETVPWTLERQRLGRNLEALRLEGLRMLTARDAGGRDEALFVVRMLAAQPGVGDDPRAAELVAEVEGFLTRVAGGAGRSDMLEWEALSARLRLLADDLSVEGGQRVTAELERMTRVMRLSRYKLMVSVLLMAAFLGSSLFVLRWLLILPLQRIRRELSALDGRAAPPDLPLAALAEIRAVGEALVRFHATLRENEEVRRKLEHLATTDGLTGLAYQESMPNGGSATATKDDKTYTISGEAIGFDAANPTAPAKRAFVLVVTCP